MLINPHIVQKIIILLKIINKKKLCIFYYTILKVVLRKFTIERFVFANMFVKTNLIEGDNKFL